MGIFDKKPTSTEVLEMYLPIFKKFAESNNLEVIEIAYDKYGYDSDKLEVTFKIKKLKKKK